MTPQWFRWFVIFVAAEGSAFALAVGVRDLDPHWIVIGINEAFVAAFIIVYDHEVRGRGK